MSATVWIWLGIMNRQKSENFSDFDAIDRNDHRKPFNVKAINEKKEEQEKKEFLSKWGPLNPFKISLTRFKRRQMRLVSFSEAENLFL